MSDGRRFRILAVVDDFTRECIALLAATSLLGARVACELNAVFAVRGKQLMVVSGDGAELTGAAILSWCQDHEV